MEHICPWEKRGRVSVFSQAEQNEIERGHLTGGKPEERSECMSVLDGGLFGIFFPRHAVNIGRGDGHLRL